MISQIPDAKEVKARKKSAKKLGRPRKPENEKGKHGLYLRFTPPDWKRIVKAADGDVNAWAKSTLLNAAPVILEKAGVMNVCHT